MGGRGAKIGARRAQEVPRHCGRVDLAEGIERRNHSLFEDLNGSYRERLSGIIDSMPTLSGRC